LIKRYVCVHNKPNIIKFEMYVSCMKFGEVLCYQTWTPTQLIFKKLVGPFWDLGVEVGLTPNCMKGIHIFPLLIVGSFLFFLPSKLDVQCMVIAKKEQNKILFQFFLKLMFNKYNKQCKVGEGHLNSYFY
jgi:hypothetical protein